MLPEYFTFLAVFISAIGSIAYLHDVIKGHVKPNEVSFLFWSVAPLVVYAVQLGNKVGIESFMTLSTGLFPLFIF